MWQGHDAEINVSWGAYCTDPTAVPARNLPTNRLEELAAIAHTTPPPMKMPLLKSSVALFRARLESVDRQGNPRLTGVNHDDRTYERRETVV